MSRNNRLVITVTALAATLAALLVVQVSWEARPAGAAFPGNNGLIVFDGSRTTLDNPEGDSEIFTMNDNGSGLTQLTSNDQNDGNAAWAPVPDEEKIVFASRRETATNPIPPGETVPDFEIYVMDAEPESATNVPVQLTNNTARDTNPTWSPGGTRIAFMSNRGLDDNEDIYVMNAVDNDNDGNGDNLKRLTKNAADDDYPTWSPNGAKIAFESDRKDSSVAEIFSMKPRPEGRKNRPRNLTRNPGDDHDPNWSPDGTKIAFASNRDGDDEIYRMRAADGANQIPLTDSQASDSNPAWSPDGSKIAFVRSIDFATNDYDIFVMGSDGSNPGNVTESPDFDSDPDWQPLP